MLGESFRACLAVCNCRVGDIPYNVMTLENLTKKAASKGAALICFPEMNLTGYYNNPEIIGYSLKKDSPILTHVSDLSSEHSIIILAGFAEYFDEERVYATHAVFYPDGRKDFYRKLHIAPPEKKVLKEGYDVPVFEYMGIKFGIQLCYDAHFPELSTKMSVSGIDVLFIPHASPRGNPEEKLKSWMRHLTARAFDNGIIVAACNQEGENGRGLFFPGIALVVNQSGELLSSSLAESDELLYFDISKKEIDEFRSGRMRYFLPSRRTDLFPI